MKSWKARLLILATMLAMLIALATPAMAEHEDDLFEEALEACADVIDYEENPDLFWQCVIAYIDYYDHDDDEDDDGSGTDSASASDSDGDGDDDDDDWFWEEEE